MPRHRHWCSPRSVWLALFALLIWALPSASLAAPPAPAESSSATAPSPSSEPGLDELGLAWTPRVILRRDQIGSPHTLVGPALGAAALRYDRTKAANAHRVDVDFAVATLRSQPDFEYLHWPDNETVSASGSPHTYVRLRYAYLRELPLARERLSLRLGPGVDFDVQAFDYLHPPASIGGYHGIFALDLRAELELRPAKRHRLRVAAGLPVLSWVARSPYAINDDESIYANRDQNGLKTFFRYLGNGEVQSWGRLQAVRVDLRYDLELHEHLALTAGVHGRVLANSVPRPLLLQEYGASLGLTARF